MSKPALRQESTIELGERQIQVVSELLLEPEVMVMTSVFTAGKLLHKTHSVLPPAAVRDYERRGLAALTSSLYAFHLRFVRKLLSASPESKPARPLPAGVLGLTRVDQAGKVLHASGEEQVPPTWLRNVAGLAAAAREVGQALGLGALDQALAEAEDVALLLVSAKDHDDAAFLENGSDALVDRATALLRGTP